VELLQGAYPHVVVSEFRFSSFHPPVLQDKKESTGSLTDSKPQMKSSLKRPVR
jgi:hypothetical protein